MTKSLEQEDTFRVGKGADSHRGLVCTFGSSGPVTSSEGLPCDPTEVDGITTGAGTEEGPVVTGRETTGRAGATAGGPSQPDARVRRRTRVGGLSG